MAKETIKINDVNLFYESLVSFSKLATSAKFMIDENGLTIYGKNSFSRGEMTSNAIFSKNPIEFCLLDIGMFIKLLNTALEIHKESQSDINLIVDLPFIKIESGKFKTKITTCKEEIIATSISTKIKTELKPVFEFTTSSDLIKRVNGHSFIFQDSESIRIYLMTDDEMENNVLYAKIGNESNDLNNSVTLKFGLINAGQLDDRKIILNFDRLAMFNIINSDSIKVSLMDKNVLVNKIHMGGKNDSSYDLTIYTSILAN